jgi:predicted O-linked N-acetylglucosamine transferase (SPINDLY family)
MPNDDTRECPAASSRNECGLPENAFVFGSFNQSNKITPEVFGIWMRLLQDKADAILWLRGSNDLAVENLRREAAGQGVSPDRLIFAPRVSAADHLARIANMDLALDCFPYNSHATACDMLWAGVPMVGLSGETFASRVSESILGAAGLPDLVTRSYEDYFDLASRLSTDPEKLAGVRARVHASKRSALFDTKRFTRSLERGFELIWERHLQGLPPDHIDVPAVQ